jgi:hypothetical protein
LAINRNGALAYAKKYWNRACEDGRIGTAADPDVKVDDFRKDFNAPAEAGWDAYFVSDGDRGENVIFGRTVAGRLVEKRPDPILTDVEDDLKDCTHYVSRCLSSEGIKITPTPSADKLITSLIKNKALTAVLAERTTKNQGQKIIDSGIFKPGDVVGYYDEAKSRYHHSAMYTGPENCTEDDVTGGITCHTRCRYGGKTWDWTNRNDDAWYISDDLEPFTLIHFVEDDSKLSIGSLVGWWKFGSSFYWISLDGTATSTLVAPQAKGDRPIHPEWSARLFQLGDQVVFIWRKKGLIQVEKWRVGMSNQPTKTVKTEDGIAKANRLFQTHEKTPGSPHQR